MWVTTNQQLATIHRLCSKSVSTKAFLAFKSGHNASTYSTYCIYTYHCVFNDLQRLHPLLIFKIPCCMLESIAHQNCYKNHDSFSKCNHQFPHVRGIHHIASVLFIHIMELQSRVLLYTDQQASLFHAVNATLQYSSLFNWLPSLYSWS